MKMLVVFSVTDRLKYIGHLDLMRAMQRALRRSGLPVRYSQGFNPHIILSFAAPLSVGSQGLREIMDVPLAGDCEPQRFIDAMNLALPPLLRCLSARRVDDAYPAPMSRLAAASYRLEPVGRSLEMLEHIPDFLRQTGIVVPRRTKKGMVDTDIRPLIFNLISRDGYMDAVLQLRESGTCKPELLISALGAFCGLSVPQCGIIRTRLLTEGFTPLEEA